MRVKVLQDGIHLKGECREWGFETGMDEGLHLSILKRNDLVKVVE